VPDEASLSVYQRSCRDSPGLETPLSGRLRFKGKVRAPDDTRMDESDRGELLGSFAVQSGAMGASQLAHFLAERAHLARPNDPTISELCAIAALEAGANADAASAAEKALASGAPTPSLEYLRCEAIRRDGRPEDATRLAKDAIGRFPNDVRLVTSLANAQLDAGHPAEAAATAGRGLEGAPDSRELHDIRARAAQELGDPTTQLEHERRLFELSPRSSAAEIRYATSLLKAGGRQRGQELLIDVLARDPRNQVARRALGESGRLPRPWRIAAAIGPGVVAVLLTLLIEPPGRSESGSGIGIWLVIGAYAFTAAAKRAWLRNESGGNWEAVKAATGSMPVRAQSFWARWGQRIISAAAALIVATVLTMSYGEVTSLRRSFGWPSALVWVVVFALVLGVCLLMFWIGGQSSKPVTSTPNPFKRLPLEANKCRCDEIHVITGASANAYGDEHLRGEFEELASDVSLASCERTRRSWLRVAVPVDGGEAPILVQVVVPATPERVGIYL
jgi:tetratricopeptide (TPR) repeat protein